MHTLLNTVMARRADELAGWLAPHLPAYGTVIDIGAGTGHNAEALRQCLPVRVVNVDIVDMGVVGERPLLFDGDRLPFADGAFAAALLLFVLQYSPDPVGLLREARRVTAGPLLVLAPTYTGHLSEATLRLHDFAWGPLAFMVARAARWISTGRCTLYARNLTTRPALMQLFDRAGCKAHLAHSLPWPGVQVWYDLFVLK